MKPLVFGVWLGLSLTTALYLRLPFLGAALVFLLMLILLYTLSTFKDIKTTMTESSVLFFGVIYISGLLSHFILLRHLPEGRRFLVLLFLMIWGGDAGAYYVGRNFGKRKLSPSVSPNKTIEGAVGGLLTTLLACIVAKLTFLPLLTWRDVLILSPLLGIFGQLGDLIESMLKRSAGVKDSSGIIPAHGGLFDKLDSIAFALPLLYYYLTFIKH